MHINGRLVGSLLIIAMLFFVLVPTSLSEEDGYPWWNENWSYRQEIILPIDTGDESTVYQPIDILFEFNNPCWVINDTIHSVRVIHQYGGRFKELESQIYDLKFTNENHISSCGLVFLIPEDADGDERYFVYYDDDETPVKKYTNHVDVEESYYSYEPIRGYCLESWFYKIIEENFIVYSVAKKGNFMDRSICQQIAKLKKESTSVLPNSGEQTISNNLIYWWFKNGEWIHTGTSQKLIKSEILIDGNLMIKFGIVSESNDGLLRSTVFYKYYYCPKEDKGIYSNVKHEIINHPIPQGEDIDVAYVTINTAVLKSNVIKELNFGKTPKFMHFYSDEERVITHELDPYPESTDWQRIIGGKDNYDLGSFPWISTDDGETGKAHAVIFDSTNVVKSGENERDGVEIHLIQSNYPKLPGLEGYTSYIYLMRNSYEPEEPSDIILPKNYTVEFNSMYYTTENGGFKQVEKQAKLYQSLIDFQPGNEEEIQEDEETEEYVLTVFTHLPQNLLLKMLGSKLLLKNSHVLVELLHDNVVVGYETSGKLAFDGNLIDWSNLSLFRKAIFSHQKPSKYIIKAYLVNSVIGDEKEFIGFEIIDLEEDTEVHIYCKSQGKIKLLYNDQNEEGVEEVETYVLKDNTVIHKSVSDSNGETTIGLPTGFSESYLLKTIYKGFLINEEEIELGLLNIGFPLKKTIDFNVHDLKIDIKDQIGRTPDFDVSISLTSENMEEPVVIEPENVEDGVYHFKNLIPADYNLKIEYDSYKIIEKIKIPQVDYLTITLYDFTVFLQDSWNLSPEVKLDVYLKSLDFAEPITIFGEQNSNDEYKFSHLYPGDYTLYINYKSTILYQNITIPAEEGKIEIVFPVVFNVTASVFNTQGNPLNNVEVKLIRNGKPISKFTDENGQALFLIPPGNYTVKVYYDKDLIAQRKVGVLNEKQLSVVTSKEPWQPYVIIAFGIIILACASVLSYVRRQKLLFLKFLSVVLVFIALAGPWWSINGSISEPHLETSTNLYLIPSNMITITRNSDVIAGAIASLDATFTGVINIIPYLLILSVIFIALNLLLEYFNRKRLSFIVLFLSFVILVGSIIAFYLVMSMLAEVTVGSLFGSGNIDVTIYGESAFEIIPCCWGLGVGFYLFLISTIAMGIILGFLLKKNYFLKQR